MVKSELVQRLVARNPHLYQRDVEKIVDAILGEITDALARFDRVELRGFGVFSTEQSRAARRNCKLAGVIRSNEQPRVGRVACPAGLGDENVEADVRLILEGKTRYRNAMASV